jgi:iron(III) transport system ATP-binding protein
MNDLTVTGVEKRLGDTDVLKGVSFDMKPGEVLALLGPSGSGKTTLLRAIAGLDHPDAGRIALGDEVLFDAAAGVRVPPERRSLGLVFQSYALWPHRTVFENVAYGVRLRGSGREETRAKVDAVLRRIGLGALAARHPHELSGGQQQRVALARAIVYEPRLLLLDEPLSNLDTKLREEARAWLRELIGQLRVSAVCVTHDQVEALALADRVVLLEGGRVEQAGTPAEIYGAPASLFAAEFMGANNRLEGAVAGLEGRAARLTGRGWELRGALRGEVRAGEPAVAIVRVERTALARGPGENALPAALQTAMFLGERWECVFTVGDARVRVWTAERPASAEAWIAFPADAVWIFPRAG